MWYRIVGGVRGTVFSTYYLPVGGALKFLAERGGGRIIRILSYYNASIIVMPHPP